MSACTTLPSGRLGAAILLHEHKIQPASYHTPPALLLGLRGENRSTEGIGAPSDSIPPTVGPQPATD